jgi:ABC-type polysaccharide/polyol phosphate export permease
MREGFQKVWARRELLLILVARNLTIRYKGSSLGFFWSLLSPVLLIAVYGTFLGLIRAPLDLPTLVSGIIVWQFLALCLGDSLQAVVGNANLVTKASFPRVMLPLAMTGANLVNFLLSGSVLLVYVFFFGPGLGNLLWLPAAILTQSALCLGLALMLACANVFFRDTEHLLSVGLLAWFFMSPVIYDPALVADTFPAWVQALFFANPMAGILVAYRAALLNAPLPAPALLGGSLAGAWAVLAAGLAVFHSLDSAMADEL